MIKSHPLMIKFLTKGSYLVAFVYILFSACYVYSLIDHFEYIGPEKRYEMERGIYQSSHAGDWSREFPTFDIWLETQHNKENGLKDWLNQNVVATMCTDEEYRQYMAERANQSVYNNTGTDQDRSGPSYAEAPPSKGPND